MRSANPSRARIIDDTEALIKRGETHDPKNPRIELRMPKGYEIVDREGLGRWLWLANHASRAIPSTEGSFLPVPSELREVFEHGLGYVSIRHPENQLYAREMLEEYFVGLAEGRQVKHEKPKKDTDKPAGRRGRRSPPRQRRRR
jgi:hypothetical protein